MQDCISQNISLKQTNLKKGRISNSSESALWEASNFLWIFISLLSKTWFLASQPFDETEVNWKTTRPCHLCSSGMSNQKPQLQVGQQGWSCSSDQCSWLNVGPASPHCWDGGGCVTPSHSSVYSRCCRRWSIALSGRELLKTVSKHAQFAQDKRDWSTSSTAHHFPCCR